MLQFQNKYRVPSARAAWWDYGWAGAYFITICTRNREHYFGDIHGGEMHLSHCGLLADVFWHEIPNHAHNVELGAFVVMPNHLHGILILDNPAPVISSTDSVETTEATETRHALSLQNTNTNPGRTPAQNRFRNQGKNTVSSITGGYKAAVTKHARRLQLPFGWQARFHDHIIRNDTEYQKINDYIETNVQNWDKDRFYGP